MSDPLALLALALLWPLFPASLLFNALVDRLRLAPLRALASFAAPLAGVMLLPAADASAVLGALPATVPPALLPMLLPTLALFTALLYAWRSLTVDDLSRWATMMGTSALALLWLPWSAGASRVDLAAAAFAFASAAAVLHLVARALTRRFGSDTLGHGRIGASHPRQAALLAVGVLAMLGAPPFPGFFAMLFVTARVPWWAAAGAGAVWWMWSWSGARLWQRAFYGPPAPRTQGRDLGTATCLLAALPAVSVSIAAYAWSATWMH